MRTKKHLKQVKMSN